MRTITASAPIRICDIGGWTDTWFARHGSVFNIAVRPLVTVHLQVFPRGTREASASQSHPFIAAALRAVPPSAGVDVDVTIRSNAPAGASTGTSASLLVALLGALDRLAGGGRGPHDLAMLAHDVETRVLGRQSGVQDQLCAGFGGINFIDVVEYPRAVVTPLPLTDTIRRQLDRRLALIYLGRAHCSPAVHETVMRDCERFGPDHSPLVTLRGAAHHARDALTAGDFMELAATMRQNTEAQAALHADLVHADAWRVIDAASRHGAIGWKVNGAGGDGGSITLLSGEGHGAKRAMIRGVVAGNAGCSAIPIAISRQGLRILHDSP